MARYIFFTGGVASGLGKGIAAASLGRLLKARGYSVTLLKLDPYFNMDSAFISPYQHGEVFVTGDGAETDFVVGHYERILGGDMFDKNAVTLGEIYTSVMKKERNGEYKETVQIVPHITDEIIARIKTLDDGKTDIIITEIGGTVGDIECTPLLEAIRQCQAKFGRKNVAYLHMTLVPFIEMSREQKTKPTQRSVKELNDIGIVPDAIVCRSDRPIDKESRRKLSLFCNVPESAVVPSLMSDEIFKVPLKLEENGLANIVLKKFDLENTVPELSGWKSFYDKALCSLNADEHIRIAVVGKYADKPSAYLSLSEALFYSTINIKKRLDITYVQSDGLDEKNVERTLKGFDGIVVPSGFGERGFEGEILACEYARKADKPCLMIGFGAQAGILGVLRGVGGIAAGTDEFPHAGEYAAINAVKSPQKCGFKKGTHKSTLLKGTKLFSFYGGKKEILERHRHKYEISGEYRERIEGCGVQISALGEYNAIDGFEIGSLKFFVGVIFRPEFTARPDNEHPLIAAFIKAACA